MSLGLLLSYAPVSSDVILCAQGTYFQNEAPGRYLNGYVYESSVVPSMMHCQMRCDTLHVRCKSLNYIANEDGSNVCEINYEAQYCALPGDFIAKEKSFYVETMLEKDDAVLCSTCGYKGVIKKTKETPGFVCLCQEGFYGDRCQHDVDECFNNPCHSNAICNNTLGSFLCTCKKGFTGDGRDCTEITSCKQLKQAKPSLSSGSHSILGKSMYCDMSSGWTLVARFSNNDSKNWMQSSGNWWYDKVSAVGRTTDPSDNNDTISDAFWGISGNEIKITRSDDSSHTALLQTTSNCLNGKTFRQKITSYGDFRNGKVWASDACLGNCQVSYGGNYQSTAGFEQHSCNGNIQNSNYIGFWCDWSTGDGAVMMVGGGGASCQRADHGIGITEENEAKFGENLPYYDFGYNAGRTPPSSYSLNLWVR